MNLLIITSGKLFGFNDVSQGQTTYSQSVTCISSGSCYKIKAEELLQLFYKSEKMQNKIKQTAEQQNEQKLQTIENTQRIQDKIKSDAIHHQHFKVHKYAYRDPDVLFSKLNYDDKNFIGESFSFENAYKQTKLYKQN